MTGRDATGFPYLAGRRIEFFFRSPDQGYLCAALRETARDREIDSAATPGDNRIFPREQRLPEYFSHVRSNRMSHAADCRESQTYRWCQSGESGGRHSAVLLSAARKNPPFLAKEGHP